MVNQQKFNLCLRKSELDEIGTTGVYKFNINIPDLNLYDKYELYVKDFCVITATSHTFNMYHLNSNTLRLKDNYSSKSTASNGLSLSNDGTILSTVLSEVRYNQNTELQEIFNPQGYHNIWITDHTTNDITDTHEWFVNFVIIASKQ
jgi:hypothetical protein